LFIGNKKCRIYAACGVSQTPKLTNYMRGVSMESRIAVISIIVENSDSVECLNRILHEYGIYIIGRMGIPYRQRGISIISVAIDAPLDIINALTGKIGRLAGVSAKTVYSKA